MNRFVKQTAAYVVGILAMVVVAGLLSLGVSDVMDPGALHAQSARVLGRDITGSIVEQWFKRIGLLNGSNGCDIALEYDSLNTARFTDCTDTANLRDVKSRTNTATSQVASGNLLLGGTAVGAAGSENYLTKTVTAITDNTFTDIITVTVPNAAHGATIPIVLHGILGAGGAVGAGECSATAYGQVVVARTAGVATVATAVALSNTGSACVAGATTVTFAYQVTSMTGANSATQTFTIQARVTRGGGSSANHVVVASASVLNWAGTGITIS